MRQLVKFISHDPYIEEEYIIEVNGQELITFCPLGVGELKKNHFYSVELSICWINDDPDSEILDYAKYGVERMGDRKYFGYFLYGRLHGTTLDVGKFKIQDEDIFYGCESLNGRFLKVPADRIHIEFFEDSEMFDE